MRLTENARAVLEARYLRDLGNGRVETPDELIARVAHAVAEAEAGLGGEVQRWQTTYLELLDRLDFLPNTPTLMNAGAPLGQLSACFVLPVGDSMDEIFGALKLMALIQQSGGGTGFSFGRLRPRGDGVSATGGEASGPVSFMRIFDCATDNIRQGGKRLGANMGILPVQHPDIMEFVDAKLDGVSFRNFNLSVGVSDAFMQAVSSDADFELVNPRTGAAAGSVRARELFEHIGRAAWTTGDPGLVFLDGIARDNPTPGLGQIEATNPCGEVPLLPYEACNLGSINLSHMVRDGQVDWQRLGQVARQGVRFLDDVVEVSRWPDSRVTDAVRRTRKIGLGVMGFAEMLIELGVPYASERAAEIAEQVMGFVSEQAREASAALAEERGVFPAWKQSRYASEGLRLRNATRTCVAPTGTISLIAGTSASIEPLFALAYHRHALDGKVLRELNPLFVKHAQRLGIYDEALAAELARVGTLGGIERVPEAVRQLFQTALEISPERHLAIQRAFQKHVDNAVSKTVNLPEDASVERVREIYQSAWEQGLKGITIYRYGSKGQQVLNLGLDQAPEDMEHYTACDPESCKL